THIKRTAQIDIEDFLPGSVVNLCSVVEFDDAGYIDQDIQFAKLLYALLNGLFNGGTIADIANLSFCLSLLLLNQGNGFPDGGFSDIQAQHSGAFAGNAQGASTPDAGAGTCDDSDLVLKTLHFTILRFRVCDGAVSLMIIVVTLLHHYGQRRWQWAD